MRDLTVALVLHGVAVQDFYQSLRGHKAPQTNMGRARAWRLVAIKRAHMRQRAYELALACHEHCEPIPNVPGMLPIFYRVGEPRKRAVCRAVAGVLQ
jgi:hypothetical protein